jgi:hypothetical protein
MEDNDDWLASNTTQKKWTIYEEPIQDLVVSISSADQINSYNI